MRAGIENGPIFRAIDHWEGIAEKALTPPAKNLIAMWHCAVVGLGLKEFSAHGFRSRHLTEAACEGVPLPEAMQDSRHKSVQIAMGDYNVAERAPSKAAAGGV